MPSYYPIYDKDYDNIMISNDYLIYIEENKFYRTEFEK